MIDALELVRQEWEEGHRRLEAQRDDPRRYRRLLDQLEVVGDGLRQRVSRDSGAALRLWALFILDAWADQVGL